VSVFVVRLICSDVECAVELGAEALEVAELETLLCDCGCTLEIIGWADWVDEPAQVIALRVEGAQLRDAA
jgi:hypothetical protein